MKQIKIFQDRSYKELGILYGLFFEDINHAADGGLYAELVQNRSFEYCDMDKKGYHALTAWEKTGNIEWSVLTTKPLNEENPHYLHLDFQEGASIRNLGYNTGIYVEEGKKYDFSFWARAAETEIPVRVTVESEDAPYCGQKVLTVSGGEWKKYETVLTAEKTTTDGRLVLTFARAGSCDLDMVSLFPQDTFLGEKGGLRKDIAQALKEMHPKFMRFPGGCLVHDGSLNDHDHNSMYRWKRTLGRVEERPSWRNNWNYNQSLGIGYYEYFCFCEKIGAEPVPVLPGGFNPHKGTGVPIEELGPWVQDALDLIEFANGGLNTVWGKIRMQLGHEEPFHLKYIGIGNEEVGDGFFERYAYFHQAIRENYPDIRIINTAGPFSAGESYDAGWCSARKYGSDLVDEHYYSSPEWFLANMHHYDDFEENGPKVFLGEYASWGNTYYNALVEAAYMTHLERSKAVAMACYAPMLCNVDYVNWRPDLLWFNNHAVLKTPNYYVQKLFMENQGTDEVYVEMEGLDEIIPLTDENGITGLMSVSGNDIEGRLWDVKVTDHETGEVRILPDISVDLENRENLLTDMKSGHYTLSFRFQRTAGRKGLKIYFGEKKLLWEFGGWDNWDCCLTSLYGGRSSILTQRIFHVEDREYFLQLEVEGRRIRAWVDGRLYNETTARLPELEELYVAASVEKDSGRTIVKAVNLTGEEKDVLLSLTGTKKNTATVTCLKGYRLDAGNTFENPDVIVPQSREITITDNTLLLFLRRIRLRFFLLRNSGAQRYIGSICKISQQLA